MPNEFSCQQHQRHHCRHHHAICIPRGLDFKKYIFTQGVKFEGLGNKQHKRSGLMAAHSLALIHSYARSHVFSLASQRWLSAISHWLAICTFCVVGFQRPLARSHSRSLALIHSHARSCILTRVSASVLSHQALVRHSHIWCCLFARLSRLFSLLLTRSHSLSRSFTCILTRVSASALNHQPLARHSLLSVLFVSEAFSLVLIFTHSLSFTLIHSRGRSHVFSLASQRWLSAISHSLAIRSFCVVCFKGLLACSHSTHSL